MARLAGLAQDTHMRSDNKANEITFFILFRIGRILYINHEDAQFTICCIDTVCYFILFICSPSKQRKHIFTRNIYCNRYISNSSTQELIYTLHNNVTTWKCTNIILIYTNKTMIFLNWLRNISCIIIYKLYIAVDPSGSSILWLFKVCADKTIPLFVLQKLQPVCFRMKQHGLLRKL